MANYANLKSDIAGVIRTNNNEEITGDILQEQLLGMVDSLGAGFQYKGVATPATAPGTPDENVFYIASTAGTYTNFGGLVVAEGEVAILKYNGSWAKEVTGAATAAQVTQLGQEVTDNSENIINLQQEIDSIQPIVIEGNVTNAPDEEDLTTENDLLKFANRSTAVNQMGYVILRKNKTFAEQVTKENTIYEIRYAFDLNGASVTIPAGCVLLFIGGLVKNGSIIGNNTRVDGGNYQFFPVGTTKYRGYTASNAGDIHNWTYAYVSKTTGDNIELLGTWGNDYVNPAWVGLDNISQHEDSRIKLQRFIDLHSPGVNINVPRNTYRCYGTLLINTSVDFNGGMIKCCDYADIFDGTIELPEDAISLPDGDTYGLEMVYGLIQLRNMPERSYLKNLIIDGNRDDNYEAIKFGISGLLNPYHTLVDFTFENVVFQNSPSCGVIGGVAYNKIQFNNCKFFHITEHGLYQNDVTSEISFVNCIFHNVGDSQRMITARNGASYIIKNTTVTEQYKIDFSLCSFVNDTNLSEKAWLNVRAGNITIKDSVFDGAVTSAFADETYLTRIDLYRCQNTFEPTGSVFKNITVRYHDCIGRIILSNYVKLIENCKIETYYRGDKSGTYYGDYVSLASEPIIVKNSTISFHSSNSDRFSTLGTLNEISFIGCSIFADDVPSRRSIIYGTPLSNDGTYKVNISDCDIHLGTRAIIVEWGGKERIFANNTDIYKKDSATAAFRTSNELTICDIRVFGAPFIDGSIAANIQDNTNRGYRYDGNSNLATDLNNYGIVTNVASGSYGIGELKPKTKGSQVYNTDYSIPVWWNGAKFVSAEGFSAMRKTGTTAQRPTPTAGSNTGYTYFDTTLGKMIVWNGTAWVNMDGSALS